MTRRITKLKELSRLSAKQIKSKTRKETCRRPGRRTDRHPRSQHRRRTFVACSDTMASRTQPSLSECSLILNIRTHTRTRATGNHVEWMEMYAKKDEGISFSRRKHVLSTGNPRKRWRLSGKRGGRIYERWTEDSAALEHRTNEQ